MFEKVVNVVGKEILKKVRIGNDDVVSGSMKKKKMKMMMSWRLFLYISISLCFCFFHTFSFIEKDSNNKNKKQPKLKTGWEAMGDTMIISLIMTKSARQDGVLLDDTVIL